MKTFKEHIIKTGNKYRLVSKKTGKNLGTYPTKAGAEKRERQVQYFKHMEEVKLDELSSDTLKSYTAKGLAEPTPSHKILKRVRGLWQANKILAKRISKPEVKNK